MFDDPHVLSWLKYIGLGVSALSGIWGTWKRTHDDNHKFTSWGKFYIGLILFGFAVAFLSQIAEDSKKREADEQSQKREQEHLNEIKTLGDQNKTLRHEVSIGFQEVRTDLATSPSVASAKRLEILDREEKKVIEKQNELLIQKVALTTENIVSLAGLRSERENRNAMLESTKAQAEIQRKRSELIQGQAAIQTKQQQEEAQRQAKQKKAAMEIRRTDEVLSVFDSVIGAFHSLLISVSKDTGESVRYDFSNRPSMRNSNMVTESGIVQGTNSIWLGTNAVWHFELSTRIETADIKPLTTTTVFLNIKAPGKDGGSTMVIKAVWLDNFPLPLESVTVHLSVPHEPQFDKRTAVQRTTMGGSGNLVPLSRSSLNKDVEEALRILIETQDLELPLRVLKNVSQ